jgi:glutamine synthetase
MSNVKLDKILKFIKDESVEYIDFRFTDILGQFHHITYKAKHADRKVLSEGVFFDGSSIRGWKGIENSDMLLIPDLDSAFLDEFTVQKTLIIICDVVDPIEGAAYQFDPRNIAKKAVALLREKKIAENAYFGPEVEFFIFDEIRYKDDAMHSYFKINSNEGPGNNATNIPSGNLGHRADLKGGYFPVQPIDTLHDIRSEICNVIEKFGLSSRFHHHEVAAAGQCEIDFEYADLVQSADNVQKFKYAVKNVAASYGKTATFMPKPIYNDNGSGMHVHMSLWKNNANLFYSKSSEYAELSEFALYCIGGIIKHARVLNAFTNPSTNSYKRLVPGFEAPVNLAYSMRNRSASIRIPCSNSSGAKRIEVRFPDPTANPYLAFSAMLLAALDGVKNKIHPGEAIDKNLYQLKSSELKKIPSVCGSLSDALKELERGAGFLVEDGVFTDEFIKNYINLKKKEVQALDLHPHPIEFKMYYSN